MVQPRLGLARRLTLLGRRGRTLHVGRAWLRDGQGNELRRPALDRHALQVVHSALGPRFNEGAPHAIAGRQEHAQPCEPARHFFAPILSTRNTTRRFCSCAASVSPLSTNSLAPAGATVSREASTECST